MRQKLCRRLEGLEKINAERAAARRAKAKSEGMVAVRARLMAITAAWRAKPGNLEWLAAQSPDFLYNRVQQLRAKLWEKASRHVPGNSTR
jgi:hypothetical protein